MSEHDRPAAPARFSALVNSCRAIAVQHLNTLYSSIFGSVDSALLEFAAKAENNAIQAQFFEAIQEIDRGSQNIKRAFEGEIKIGFAQFAKGRPLAVAGGTERTPETLPPAPSFGFDTNGLQLLDKLAHAESAVIQTLAAKSTHRYRGALYALNQRLAVVNSGRRLEEIAVPAGPSHILYAFGASIRALRIEPNVKLVLFALFDRLVMSQLEALYEDLNRCLMKAGVLAHLRPSVRKQADSGLDTAARAPKSSAPPSTASSAPAQTVAANGNSVGDALFSTILELLAKHRRAASPPSSEQHAAPSVASYPDNTVLVAAINQAQTAQASAEPSGGAEIASVEADEQAPLEKIRRTLHAERQRIYEGMDRRRIPQVDIDVIDLVGMVFDCVLNDETLPSVVKALLSRLHTPYLKIAVLDKKIFTAEQHAARRLLNDMVDAGAKWVDQNKLRAGIFPQMQYVVNRVLREFHENLPLFDELLTEFTEAVDALKQKAALIELRAGEAAAGHEKLQAARARAHHELVLRTAGHSLPPTAKKFLAEVWADHLMLILLRTRDGEHSPYWVEALRVADEIVWSVTPKPNAEERVQLATRLPELQRTIEEELGSLGGYGRHAQEDLFALLKAVQERALSSDASAADAINTTTPADEVETLATLPPADEFAGMSDEERALIDELRSLKVGTWFDFKYSESGNTRRLKLSWYSPTTSSCLFVDQAGVKAAVYSIQDLARAVHSGNARRVETRRIPFFEWALDAIRGKLGGS